MNNGGRHKIRTNYFTKDFETEKSGKASPSSSIMSKLSQRLKQRFANNTLMTMTVNSPTTKVSDVPFAYKTYNTDYQI